MGPWVVVMGSVEPDVHPRNVHRSGEVSSIVDVGIIVAMSMLKVVRTQQPMQPECLGDRHQQQELLPINHRQQQLRPTD